MRSLFFLFGSLSVITYTSITPSGNVGMHLGHHFESSYLLGYLLVVEYIGYTVYLGGFLPGTS